MTVEFHLLSLLVGIVLGAMIHPPLAMERFLRRSRFPKRGGVSFKAVRVATRIIAERQCVYVSFGQVRSGARVVASVTRGNVWSGDPEQLAIWVKAGSIELRNVDPSVRPETEQLVVGMMRKEIRGR